MTYKQFFEQIIAYFGKYQPGKGSIVAEWVKKYVKEDYLKPLFEKLVETMESKYKTPPDIHEIKKVYSELPRYYVPQLPEPVATEEEAKKYIADFKKIIEKTADKSNVRREE